jgi:hypothetical protein
MKHSVPNCNSVMKHGSRPAKPQIDQPVKDISRMHAALESIWVRLFWNGLQFNPHVLWIPTLGIGALKESEVRSLSPAAIGDGSGRGLDEVPSENGGRHLVVGHLACGPARAFRTGRGDHPQGRNLGLFSRRRSGSNRVERSQAACRFWTAPKTVRRNSPRSGGLGRRS